MPQGVGGGIIRVPFGFDMESAFVSPPNPTGRRWWDECSPLGKMQSMIHHDVFTPYMNAIAGIFERYLEDNVPIDEETWGSDAGTKYYLERSWVNVRTTSFIGGGWVSAGRYNKIYWDSPQRVVFDDSRPVFIPREYTKTPAYELAQLTALRAIEARTRQGQPSHLKAIFAKTGGNNGPGPLASAPPNMYSRLAEKDKYAPKPLCGISYT